MSGIQMSLSLAVGVTLVAAVWDQRTGFIPNSITYPLFCLGALAHLFLTLNRFPRASSLVVVLEIVAGACLCALVPFLLWRKSAMGGGDVKLLGGLGALLGPSVGLELELYAFLCAAAIAPLVLAYRGPNTRELGSKGLILKLLLFRQKGIHHLALLILLLQALNKLLQLLLVKLLCLLIQSLLPASHITGGDRSNFE